LGLDIILCVDRQFCKWLGTAYLLFFQFSCSAPAPDPHLTIDLTPKASTQRSWSSLAVALGQIDVPLVATKCGPAVVVIVGASKQGSGVILSRGHLVVTNAHVVEDGDSFAVRLLDGRSVTGEVVMRQNELDLALLRLPMGDYPSVDLGDSDQLKPGERVVAIGAPLGLEQTVASGEVAAIRDVGGTPVLQISVPISHGSSGGGLFDAHGLLVGITTASATNGQNLNFAMPASAVRLLLSRAGAAGIL
jgi:S1-C subfamily serine protease